MPRISGLGQTAIDEMIRTGALKSVKHGRSRLIVYESLKRLALKRNPSFQSTAFEPWLIGAR